MLPLIKTYFEVMPKKRFVISLLVLVFAISCNDNKQGSSATNIKVEKKDSSVNKIKTIIFFGNSLTAGYGLEPSQAFPAIIQKKLDSSGLRYKVINAGVSGETTSGGKGRIDWILKQPVDVFVLELGANDGLRGIPISETKTNLQSIIDKVKLANPAVKIILAGMQIPPNMGEQYASEFRDVYPSLASKNNITLIPFVLEGVGGEVKLNQDDGIHPTEEGHKIVAENIWKVMKDIL